MVEGRIIRRSLRHTTGHVAKWFEIETVHDGKSHLASDHTYATEDEARIAAAAQCDRVDSILYVDDR